MRFSFASREGYARTKLVGHSCIPCASHLSFMAPSEAGRGEEDFTYAELHNGGTSRVQEDAFFRTCAP